MNNEKAILHIIRQFYPQSSMISLPNTKKALEGLNKGNVFKYKYQYHMAYHVLRKIIKDNHTKNRRFIASSLLTTSYPKIVKHYLDMNYKWQTIDNTITLLAVSLRN